MTADKVPHSMNVRSLPMPSCAFCLAVTLFLVRGILWLDYSKVYRTKRGASFEDSFRGALLSSTRPNYGKPSEGTASVGFRIVQAPQ